MTENAEMTKTRAEILRAMVLQSITTKYLSPTDFKGSRIKATSSGGLSVTIGYPHEMNQENGHRAAAEALANKYNWLDDGWQLAQGGGPSDGYVFVLVHPTR